MSIGVPIKVLHEAEGHIVTCETNTGEVYRGKLIEAEDNMNCQVGLTIFMGCLHMLEQQQMMSGDLRLGVIFPFVNLYPNFVLGIVILSFPTSIS